MYARGSNRNKAAVSESNNPRRLRRWQLKILRTATTELTDADWDELLALYTQTYEILLADLQASVRGKSFLYRVYERATGRLVGAAAYAAFPIEVPGKGRIVVFYAGDIVLRPEIRGAGLIQEMGLGGVIREVLRDPWTPKYLYAIALTHKLYRSVASMFQDYWPRHDRETPPEILEIMERVGRRVDQNRWRSATELLQIPRRGRQEQLAVPEEQLADPVIRFFIDKNPTYLQGTCLPIMMPLDARNLASVVRTLVARRSARTRPRA